MGSDRSLLEKIEERFDDCLRQRELYFTPQRRLLLRIAFGDGKPFTSDGLWKRALQHDETLSRATAFRTVALLRETGFIRELEILGKRLYCPNQLSQHSSCHLVCADCGSLEEFSDEQMTRLEHGLVAKLGFEAVRRTICIEGACQELRVTGQCSKAAPKTA